MYQCFFTVACIISIIDNLTKYGIRNIEYLFISYFSCFSLSKDLHKAREKIGYCPQFDALYDDLTAREHLLLYSRLKGVPRKDQKKVSQDDDQSKYNICLWPTT